MPLDSSVEVGPFLSALSCFLKRSLLSKQLIRSLLPVLSRLKLKKRDSGAETDSKAEADSGAETDPDTDSAGIGSSFFSGTAAALSAGF